MNDQPQVTFTQPAENLPLEYWTSLASAMETIRNTTGNQQIGCKDQMDTLVRCFEHPFNPIATTPIVEL